MEHQPQGYGLCVLRFYCFVCLYSRVSHCKCLYSGPSDCKSDGTDCKSDGTAVGLLFHGIGAGHGYCKYFQLHNTSKIKFFATSLRRYSVRLSGSQPAWAASGTPRRAVARHAHFLACPFWGRTTAGQGAGRGRCCGSRRPSCCGATRGSTWRSCPSRHHGTRG